MTTKVAYTYKNEHRTEFMDAAGAYKTLDSWNCPNFDGFIQAPRGEVVPGGGGGQGQGGPLPAPKVKVLKLYAPATIHGVVSSGIIMSGETAELKVSLNGFADRHDNLQGVMGEVDSDYWLLACYVRVKHGRGSVKTIINIGPVKSWWMPVGTSVHLFEPSPWRKFKDAYDSTDLYDMAFGFRQLASKLDECERPNKAQGEKEVPVVAV
jgi:hypothetical protein